MNLINLQGLFILTIMIDIPDSIYPKDSNGNPLRFKCLHIASLNITISASVETWFSGEMDARPCRLLQPAATNNQLPDRLLRKLSARAA